MMGLSIQGGGGSGGANRSLSNLANVMINECLDFDPGGDTAMDLIRVNVTGSPKLWWDEASDSFETNKSLSLPGGSLKIGDFLIQQDTVDNDGLKKVGALHIHESIGGVAGNLCLHEGTEPTVSASGAGHRLWVDAGHNLQWQDEAGVSVVFSPTDWDAAYTHAQNNSQAHSDYLKNDANDSTTGDLTAAKFIATILESAAGTLKIQPGADVNVSMFASSDVGNADDGREFRIWRNAPEGNSYLRIYGSANQNMMVHSNNSIVFQNASGKNIQFNSGQHIYLNLGDQAGNDEIKIRDAGGLEVGIIDSNGNVWFRGDLSIGVNSDVLIQADGASYFNGGNVSFNSTILVDTIDPFTGGGWITLGRTLVENRLHVQGAESAGGTNATIEIENTAAGGDRWFLRAGATGTPTPPGGFSIADTTGYRFTIDENGNVGIGTGLIPAVLPLEVRSADDNQIIAFDSRAQAQGVGGGIAFGGKYTDAGAEAMAGRIGAQKTNATSGDVAFDMIFETQNSGGTMTERMKLTSGGDLLPAGTVDGRDVATDGTKLDGIDIGAEAATKEFFTSAGAAILSSNASYPTPNDTYHLALADGVTFARCFFVFHLPGDFSSMASGYPKVVFKQGTGGTGNYRIAFNGRAGGVGEQMGSVLDNIAEYTMAAPGQGDELWEEDISASFDGLTLAAGDSVGLRIQRDSDDSLDTFSGDLDVVGVVVKYV